MRHSSMCTTGSHNVACYSVKCALTNTSLSSPRLAMKPNHKNKIKNEKTKSQPAAVKSCVFSSSPSITPSNNGWGPLSSEPEWQHPQVWFRSIHLLTGSLPVTSVFLLVYQSKVQAEHRKLVEGGRLPLTLLPQTFLASKHKSVV